jgi:ubiquinone/menaquinone biosynthesis C-methylase UbiE/MoaA/NifB/PqqE/SkfB family radical SAM enzyme
MYSKAKAAITALSYMNYFVNHRYFYKRYALSLARKMLGHQIVLFTEVFFEKRCNFRCWHCSSSQTLSLKDEGLSLPQIETVVRKLRQAGAVSIGYVGGESTIRKDLCDIIALTHRHEVVPVIISNAWLLTPDKIDDLFAAGLGNLGISLQSSVPETHDHLVNKPGAHARVMAAIDYCQSKSYPVSICVVPTNANLADGDFDRMMEMALRRRIRVNANLPASIGSIAGADDALLTPQSLKILQDRYFPMENFWPDFKVATGGNKIWCPLGETSLYVMPDGDVCPCTFVQISFGNILTDDIGDIIGRMRRSSLVRDLRRDGQCPIAMDRPFIESVRAIVDRAESHPPRWVEPAAPPSGEKAYWDSHYAETGSATDSAYYTWLADVRHGHFGLQTGLSIELGAGTGEFAARAGVSVVTDVSEAAVRQAIAGSGRLGVVADATRLPFADGTFQAVFANDVLHHIKVDRDLPTAIAEVRRVLAADGRFCVSDRLPTAYNSFILALNERGRAVVAAIARRLGRRIRFCGSDAEPEMTAADWMAIRTGFVVEREKRWRSVLHFWLFSFSQVARLLLPDRIAGLVGRAAVKGLQAGEVLAPAGLKNDTCLVLRKPSDETPPMSEVPLQSVRDYWHNNPLLSHELERPGSPEFFSRLDAIKRYDTDTFAFPYWGFDQFSGKRVLDIGCGPGWLTVQYAKGGAVVNAVDLTPKAVELTRAHLACHGLSADVAEANAESLPFADGTFDLVVASGVLHHTPDTQTAFREAFRVTRPGGQGRITLYRKGILHRPAVFRLTRLVMRLLGVRHPGADLGHDSTDVDDFIRRYDGAENPVGIGKTDADWAQDLTAIGWQVVSREIHFFPRRFLPFAALVPAWAHRILDSRLGTVVYFTLSK